MAKSGGKGGFWRSKRGTGILALDFSPDAISLFERGHGGAWSEIARAATGASDFAEQVDALRVEALIRDKRQAPITLWLPEDQIIERTYQLEGATDDTRRAEAARRIASETSHLAPELSVAVATGSRGEPVKVLAVLLQTMIEARSYAANWGFNPGPISTRVAAESFGAVGPVFEFPHTAVQKAGRTMRRVAVVASTLALFGAAGFGGYHLIQPLLQTPVEVQSSGPAPSSFAVFLDPPPDTLAPLRAVETTPASSLAMQRLALRPEIFEPGLGTLTYARVKSADVPVVLTEPDGPKPLRVGSGLVAPGIREIATLGDALTGPASARIAALTPDAGDEIAPTDTAAAGTSNTTTDPARDETTDPDATEAGDAEETEDLTPTEFAPQQMADVPKPRPEPEAETAEETATTDTAEADAHTKPAIPAERPEDLAAAPAGDDNETAPEATAEPATDAVTPKTVKAPDESGTAGAGSLIDTGKLAGGEEKTEERPSVFAAVEAPEPSKRPRTLEFAAKRLPKRSSTPLSVYLPKTVKEAAKRTGLALDKTNLIGIIDAKSGREALLRLSDGQFRKVSRGDNVDGWRVSAIGREAVRLSRKGQHRTLLLVSP